MRMRKFRVLGVFALVSIFALIYLSAPSKVDGILWVNGDITSSIKEQVPIVSDPVAKSETDAGESASESHTESSTDTNTDATSDTGAETAKEAGTDKVTDSADSVTDNNANTSSTAKVEVEHNQEQPSGATESEPKQQTTEAETEYAGEDAESKAHAEERRKWLAEIQNKAPDTLEPKGNKVVLLTASDGKGHNGEIENLLQMVNENREDYCAFHGYTYQFTNITQFHSDDRPPVWSKIPAIQQAFELHPDAEWVWWLDTDAIIMTPSLDLAQHVLSPEAMKKRIAYDAPFMLPNGKESGFKVSRDLDLSKVDAVVSQDHNGVNAGSILFRRSDWTFAFLDMWIDPIYVQRRFDRFEQDALNHIIVNHPRIRSRVAVVPQRVMNAFSVGDDQMGWMTGDLVVHFAGC
ncbi:galactosyl transferase GMA12/MNN10 family-domain-containing protein [Lipomyces mesembrius]